MAVVAVVGKCPDVLDYRGLSPQARANGRCAAQCVFLLVAGAGESESVYVRFKVRFMRETVFMAFILRYRRVFPVRWRDVRPGLGWDC